MNDFAAGAVLAREEADGVCRIDLIVNDAMVVSELLAFPAGSQRETYALTALRIGVLALKQAQGRLDADVIRGEGDRLMSTLERLLRAQVGASDSELTRTLAAHVGEQSALMKILRPTETEGILNSLSQAMAKALQTHRKESNQDDAEFRANLLASLAATQARKEESLKSTRHGLEFEQSVVAAVAERAQAAGDIVQHAGGTTGLIKNCKVGDAVVTLGPEHAAAGSRIVVEAKEDASYGLANALAEIEQARKNRDAAVGVFVLSKRTAESEIVPLARYGDDIVCLSGIVRTH